MALLLCAGPAHAGEEETLTRVQTYLNELRTLSADFTQTGPDGSVTYGKFYLKRPGRLRWQFDPPTPVLMVADGSQFVYYDSELEQVTYVPFEDSLAAFLAQESINLKDPFIDVTDVTTGDEALSVTLVQKDKKENGTLTLDFAEGDTLALKGMKMIDPQGNTTALVFHKLQHGAPLSDKLFRFIDPRKRRVR